MNLDPVKKLMYEQDFEGAEKLLQAGLKTEKDKFMIFYFLGLVYFELRKLDKIFWISLILSCLSNHSISAILN